ISHPHPCPTRRSSDLAGAMSGAWLHENAGADTDFDASGYFERDQCFAHRRARNAEQHGELAFGRQARPGGEFAAVDERGDLARDLPIEPDRFDDLQRHVNVSPAWRAGARLVAGPDLRTHLA